MKQAAKILSLTTLKRALSGMLPQKDNPYLIKVLNTFVDENTQKLMVKFKYIDNRIGGVEEVNAFINSSLIYFVHPRQLFLLGNDFNDATLQRLETKPRNNVLQRFKRIFHRS